MKDDQGREWISSSEGDILVIVHPVKLMFVFDSYVELYQGDIVMSLGRRMFEDDGEMLYLTVYGIGSLPDDAIFYIHESTKL